MLFHVYARLFVNYAHAAIINLWPSVPFFPLSLNCLLVARSISGVCIAVYNELATFDELVDDRCREQWSARHNNAGNFTPPYHLFTISQNCSLIFPTIVLCFMRKDLCFMQSLNKTNTIELMFYQSYICMCIN